MKNYRFIWGGLLFFLITLFGTAGSRADFPAIKLVPVSEGALIGPVGIKNPGDGTDRLFIVDQRGKIQIIDGAGALLPVPFLDIEADLVPQRPGFDERGLLGLAFHPDYGNTGQPGEGKFYVYYSAPSPNAPGTAADPVDHMSVISEYCVSAGDPNVADAASERILLTFDQPQFNHDGGDLAFGPVDGLLYISTGDGGSSNDNNAGHTGGDAITRPDGVLGNSQDRTNLLGKILRIDPLGSNGPGGEFGIPAGNPFVGDGGGVREEIFAYGLRNPWRMCFDDGPGGTNRLFVADVGQGDIEEIDIVQNGDNLGWRNKEGTFDFDATAPGTGPFVDPIAQYAHPGDDLPGLLQIGRSVTGGCVYRGSKFPTLQGKYLFADWSDDFQNSNGTMLGLEETSPGIFELEVLRVLGGNPIGKYITAFGEDEAGEIYIATRTVLPPEIDPDTLQPTGGIFRIEAGLTEVTTRPFRTQDNTLFEESDNLNGRGVWLFSGLNQNGDDRRALFQFGIAGRIPEGSTITAVTLQLTMDKTTSGPANFDLHRMTESWGGAPRDQQIGDPPTAGAATWNFSKFNTDAWTAAGGDFVGTVSASASVDQTGDYQWSSAQLIDDVQSWLDGTADNFGWILLSTESSPPTAKRFKSRFHGPIDQRPQIRVDYITDMPPRFQPDAHIQEVRGLRRLIGHDIYNRTGRGQKIRVTRASKINPGGYFFWIQNDGDFDDNFLMRGTGGNKVFEVRYFQHPRIPGDGVRKNVTGEMIRGTLRLGDLIPHYSSVRLSGIVRLRRDNRKRVRQRRLVNLATSGFRPASRDKLKIIVTTAKR